MTAQSAASYTSTGYPVLPGQPPAKGLQHFLGPAVNLSAGTKITLSSTAGGYWVIGDRNQNGTASGTFSLTVENDLANGYPVSISSGSLTFDGVTYTVSSGSGVIGHWERFLVAQGTAVSPVVAGQQSSSNANFILRAFYIGNFGGEGYAVVHLILMSGGVQYRISLLAAVSLS